MDRARVLGFLAGALALLTLAAPAPASASLGTYTWNLASDFTATGPGADPDHDQYGSTPWSYVAGPASGSIDPSTFSRLPKFAVHAGLATWSESIAGAPPLVGINPTGAPITGLGATVQPGQVFLEPGPGSQAVAVGWTSPLSQTETVSINGSLTSDDSGPGPCAFSKWTLEKNATPLTSGLADGTVSASFSVSATVAPGDSIHLALSNAGGGTCAAAGLTLQIQANGTSPVVTVTSPAPGSSSTVSTLTFTGAAGSAFGDGSQVIVRVYSGQAPASAPVQTVTVPRSGAVWSATLASPLALGTYTAQAEQDDIASPRDAGLSPPVTFSVRLPVITLNSLGSKPLTTSTPTLSGTADTDAGSEPFAIVEIYNGATATGSPLLHLTTAVGAAGQFSVQVTPALADGTYTAVAGQGDQAGGTGLSAPQTFALDTHAPPVTLLRPGTGSRADLLQLVFTGGAGNASFDSHVVTVTLYKGKKAAGKGIGTVQAQVTGSSWTARWPGTLRPARYTALASQTDVVGHVGMSSAHTFRVLPLPPVIGNAATINPAGRVSVKITCNEPAGDTCSGSVLVLTRGKFQPLAGGPDGRLTVLFAYVHIPGGHTQTTTRTALAPVAVVLRRHATVAVTISANLRPLRGQAIHASVRHNLRRSNA